MGRNQRFEAARRKLLPEEDELLRKAAADFFQELKQKYPDVLAELRRRAGGKFH